MHLFDTEIYKKRRDQLKRNIGKGKILFLGNDNSSINYKDNYYNFRQDSTFLYYFGLSESRLSATIDIDKNEEIIFGNELTIDDIIWIGPLPTLAEMAKKVGIDETKATDKLGEYIDTSFLYLPPYRPEHQIKLSRLFSKSIEDIHKDFSADLIMTISDQRVVKSHQEIQEMHKACSYSAEMHLALMRSAKAGMKEHELVGIIEKVGMDHNVFLSYTPICTINGQTLHNHYYGNTLSEGDMVLVDAGLDSPMYYAGDLTRTFPVSKKFTSVQKDMYDVVYQAFMHAVEAAKPGMLFKDLHLSTSAKLAEGLKEIGLIKGNPQDAVIDGAHTMFFQCGLGHLIGLDVHDMENFGEEYIGYTVDLKKSDEFGLKSLRLGKALQEGYTVTIEPGLYLIPELMDKKKAEGLHRDFINYDLLEKFRDFGGIRLEDNFVIRKDGAELLGMPLARTSSEIEEIRYEALS